MSYVTDIMAVTASTSSFEETRPLVRSRQCKPKTNKAFEREDLDSQVRRLRNTHVNIASRRCPEHLRSQFLLGGTKCSGLQASEPAVRAEQVKQRKQS